MVSLFSTPSEGDYVRLALDRHDSAETGAWRKDQLDGKMWTWRRSPTASVSKANSNLLRFDTGLLPQFQQLSETRWPTRPQTRPRSLHDASSGTPITKPPDKTKNESRNTKCWPKKAEGTTSLPSIASARGSLPTPASLMNTWTGCRLAAEGQHGLLPDPGRCG